CALLAKDPHLAVTAIFQTWLQWFKTAGSGVEWPELVTVEKECHQLYEQYKEEGWHPLGVLVVVRSKEWSKDHGSEERANCGDIMEASPSTPKAAAGSVAKGLATLPRVVTTSRSKEKGKGKGKLKKKTKKIPK
ncbi:hypothetical protein C0989_002322, partial [Termitomyces sp. Mn162]